MNMAVGTTSEPSTGGPLPRELATFVDQLVGAYIVFDTDYRIVAANDAYRAAFCPDGEVIGRRCYEVSHRYTTPCDQAGESCPRRNAVESGHCQRTLHVHHTSRGEEYVQVHLYPLRDAGGDVTLFVEHMAAAPAARVNRAADGLVGRAPAFVAMMEQVSRVAPTDTAVLLLGETGTGKEMVARAIHEGSPRARMPFVPVDCSGLAETLVESELFGHEKGAFTGALARKSGLVEAAAGGTLFLDEVGDIPLGLQVKLLRLLETGTFRRVGGVEPQQANFRLIAATHRDLSRRVHDEQFRADLYYRLAAFPIRLPPLRRRREDIPLLAESLLSRLSTGRAHRLAPDAIRCLMRYDYPGNVRELRNILERASLLTDGALIERSSLPAEIDTDSEAEGRRSNLADAGRRAFEQAVADHAGTRRELAAALGIGERTLYRKLRELRGQ